MDKTNCHGQYTATFSMPGIQYENFPHPDIMYTIEIYQINCINIDRFLELLIKYIRIK